MADCLLALDAGGTGLKAALMARTGEPLPGGALCEIPMARGAEPAAMAAFAEAGRAASAAAGRLGLRIARVGVCCPGPFDFAAGMSRMRHKWQDAYERPIAPVLRAALGQVPVDFLHDSSAFLLGEGLYGAGQGVPCLAGVMLGTGLGFGYMVRGRVQVSPDQGPRIKLWNRPFRDGISEDSVSGRAIRARYARLGGDGALSVRAIAAAAASGDGAVREAFLRTGTLLGEILGPVLAEIGATHLVLGGQISRSAALFLPGLRLDVQTRVAAHLGDAALRGIAAYCLLGHAGTIEEGEA